MLNLIKMEIKKSKLGDYFKAVLIANVAIMGMLCLVYFGDRSEGTLNPFPNYDTGFALMGNFIRATFIILASVVLSRTIIDEYKNKTISLMFMYPINRKRIMISKLIIVSGFAFVTIILSHVLIGSVFYLADAYFNFVPSKLTIDVLIENVIKISVSAFAAAGVSLIPLYFGMLKKSVPVTIVSAMIVVACINTSSNELSLYTTLLIPLALAVVGAFIAFLSFRKIETVDVN